MEGIRKKIKIGDQELVAVIEDNPVTRSCIIKLPTTVNFSDFAGGKKLGIAYAPVARGDSLGTNLTKQKVLKEIADKHHSDRFQVLLAWCIRNG
ncbi:hypothetical protein WQ54_28960 [Bacillus sp. SA1-12]|uniref:cyclophilin-like fold protein n=1 Tax=Bacillus sp. SA1-12 TaxID=1455638 RepID=UPI0006270C96|nr:cyclophilin-like fold protein [Bacillus sp. SA1-12]KKI88946.1 hypothetical protein WQ54_28960 [Bacillus sp. SA1-12]